VWVSKASHRAWRVSADRAFESVCINQRERGGIEVGTRWLNWVSRQMEVDLGRSECAG
jgi:hypothetical protein